MASSRVCLNDQKTVEPIQRLVGGRFGFAFHRFPIKGGISPIRAHQIYMSQAITKAIARPSYFYRLLSGGQNALLRQVEP